MVLGGQLCSGSGLERHGCIRAGGNRASGSGQRRNGRRRGSSLPLAGLPLHIVQLVLHHPAEVGGSAAELSQGAPQRAGQFRQLLRAKNDQGN